MNSDGKMNFNFSIRKKIKILFLFMEHSYSLLRRGFNRDVWSLIMSNREERHTRKQKTVTSRRYVKCEVQREVGGERWREKGRKRGGKQGFGRRYFLLKK